MLTKVVVLFLVGIAVLAMFGRLRVGPPRSGRRRPPAAPALPRLCPACNRLVTGSDPCPCGGDRPPPGGGASRKG